MKLRIVAATLPQVMEVAEYIGTYMKANHIHYLSRVDLVDMLIRIGDGLDWYLSLPLAFEFQGYVCLGIGEPLKNLDDMTELILGSGLPTESDYILFN